jgi:hypothetical protein
MNDVQVRAAVRAQQQAKREVKLTYRGNTYIKIKRLTEAI